MLDTKLHKKIVFNSIFSCACRQAESDLLSKLMSACQYVILFQQNV